MSRESLAEVLFVVYLANKHQRLLRKLRTNSPLHWRSGQYNLLMPPLPHNLETDSRFPSGEWIGFFLQPSISRDRRRMELSLTFSSGNFTGEGSDGVGDFTIRGRYDLKTGEVTFHKDYISQHSVFYRGWNEGKGIWGTWEISVRAGDFGFSDKGGFHIWPKGMGGPMGVSLLVVVGVRREVEEVVLVGEEVVSGR